MSRKEVVLLVSQAIAILQFVEAIVYLFFSVPTAVYSLRSMVLRARLLESYRPQWNSLQKAQLWLIFGRVAVQFLVAYSFGDADRYSADAAA